MMGLRVFLAIGMFLLGSMTGFRVEAQTVYVTKTGEKYHKGSCHYLKQTKIEIDLKKAIEYGYTPCSVCKPPRLGQTQSSSSSSATSNLGSSPSSTSGNAASRQCSATTQAGNRCSRTTTNANGRCWQHQGG